MKMVLYSVLLLILAAATFAEGTSIPQVDHVIASLSNQEWEEDETVCRDKIFNLLDNVKNSTLWATWIWDANQVAPNGIFLSARFHLGNYDQCLRPSWLPKHPELRTQYCLADIEMSKNPRVKNLELPGPYGKAEDYYIHGGTIVGRSFSFMSYGVCLPAGCKDKSVEKFTRALLRGQHLQGAWDADVKIYQCKEAGEVVMPSRGYYIYMYTIAILAFIAIASTYYVSNRSDKAVSGSLVSHVAKSFCLRRNCATVFKEDKDALQYLHGIRVLLAYTVVQYHAYVYTCATSVSNGLDLEKDMHSPDIGPQAIRADLYVDTFFAMAGLFLGRSISTLDVTKPYNLLKMIVRRYLRLIGPLALAVFYMAYAMLYSDDGPVFHKLLKRQQEDCEKNGWISLLMLGNYINADSYCYLPSWSIYCDFQFYVLTLILLYIYRKNPEIGKTVITVVVVFGILSPAITAYVYDFPAVFSLGIGLHYDLRDKKPFSDLYIKAHNRMPAHMAGLFVGYMMSVYKPADHKKVWSKTVSILGAITSFGLMYTVMVLDYIAYEHRVFGPLAWLNFLLDRTVFVVGFLSLITFCTYGDVPLLTSFYSWRIFKPLSHLSYSQYLVHSMLLYRHKFALRDHLRYNADDIAVTALGVTVLSLMLSMVVWLLVEAPLNNLFNDFLDVRSQSEGATANGTKEKVAEENNIEKQKTI